MCYVSVGKGLKLHSTERALHLVNASGGLEEKKVKNIYAIGV